MSCKHNYIPMEFTLDEDDNVFRANRLICSFCLDIIQLEYNNLDIKLPPITKEK